MLLSLWMVMVVGLSEKACLRVIGHENGTKSVRDIVEASAEIGIKHLTLYAFLQKIGNVQN